MSAEVGPTPGRTALDLAVVVVATAAVLSVLDDSYVGRQHLLVGLLPLLVLAPLALSLRDREVGGYAFGILSLLLYAPLGALVALRAPGPWLVPELDASARLIAATVLGPRELVSTLPPVTPTGELLVAPYAIGYLAGGAALWLALASRRSWTPVVPLLLGLAAAIALGTLVPGNLVGRGALLAALLVWWVAVRGRRAEGAGAGGVVTHAVVAAVVVALASSLALVAVPDDDETDRTLLRGQLGSPVDTEDVSDPVAPARAQAKRRQVLLLTRGVPAGERLRFGALDEYDGQTWVPAGRSPGAGAEGLFQRVGSRIVPLGPGEPVDVEVEVRAGYDSDWLPTVGELTSLELDYTDGRTQLSQVRYNQSTASALVVGGVDPRDRYRFRALVGGGDLARGDTAARADAAQRQPRGDFLDRYLRPWAGRRATPLDDLRAFTADLARVGTTRLTASGSLGPRALTRRMLAADPPVGSPHQYAGLVALAASRLGVPARLVVGAVPDQRGRVRAGDVVSWVEVQVADGSWRELPERSYLGRRVVADEEALAAIEALPDRSLRPRDDVDLPKGSKPELGPDAEITPPGPGRDLTGVLGGLLAGLVLLLGLGGPLLKVLRRRWRRRRGPAPARLAGAWQEVLDAARDTGDGVPEHLPRPRQAARLGRAEDLARRVDAAVFAPVEPDPAEVEQVWDAALVERHALLAAHGRRRRAWAVLSPASLLSSLARRRGRSEPGAEDRRPRREHATHP